MKNCDYVIDPKHFRRTAEPPPDLGEDFALWMDELYSRVCEHPKGGPAREAYLRYDTLHLVLTDPTYSLKPNFVVAKRMENAMAFVFAAKALAVLNGEPMGLLETLGWQMMDGALDGYGVELGPELVVALARESDPDRLRLFQPDFL